MFLLKDNAERGEEGREGKGGEGEREGGWGRGNMNCVGRHTLTMTET